MRSARTEHQLCILPAVHSMHTVALGLEERLEQSVQIVVGLKQTESLCAYEYLVNCDSDCVKKTSYLGGRIRAVMIYEAGALRAVYRAIVADERAAAMVCRSTQPATTRRAIGASSGQWILWTCADLPGVRPAWHPRFQPSSRWIAGLFAGEPPAGSPAAR